MNDIYPFHAKPTQILKENESMSGDWYRKLVKECEDRYGSNFVMLNTGKFSSERAASEFWETLSFVCGSSRKADEDDVQRDRFVKITQADDAFHLTFAGNLSADEMSEFLRKAFIQGKRLRNALGSKVADSPLGIAYQEATLIASSGGEIKRRSLIGRLWNAITLRMSWRSSRESEKEVFVRLVGGMVTKNGRRFVKNINESFALCEKGETLGLCAIEEAIRIRAGGRDVRFYKVGITARKAEEIEGAKEVIIALARNHMLLADPAFSGNMISCFLFYSDDRTKASRNMISLIFDMVGSDEAYAYQLLDHHNCGQVRLRNRLGDDSFINRIQKQTQVLSHYSSGPTYTHDADSLLIS
jgi:hypothetical protein